MRAPIVKHYKGFILLAQSEQDLAGKIDCVNQGKTNGFYTVEDYINSREYDYKIYENMIEQLKTKLSFAEQNHEETKITSGVSLQMGNPIFPDIRHKYSVIYGVEQLTLRTHIRKKRGKKWFLWVVFKTQPITESNDINEVYKAFIKEVYAVIVLGKIPIKAEIDDRGLFVVDTKQQSEEERLMSLYVPKFNKEDK